jgi:hypothetical protein
MNNKLGTYEQVTTDYVVAGCKMRLGIKDSSEDDLFLADAVNRGLKRLRSFATFIPAVATLPIDSNFVAKLPTGFVKFNNPFPIVYVDEFGKIISNANANAPAYINNTFFTDSPFSTNANLCYGGTVNVQGGYLFFSTNITARFVKIEFLTANVDNSGNLIIPAIAEDALTCFGCREYVLAFPDGFTGFQFQTWDNEWKSGKKELKGIFNGSQGIDQPYITYKMSTLC